MELEYTSRFKRDLKKIKDKRLQLGIKKTIENLEQSKTIKEIEGLLKMKGKRNYYRIKRKELGDHRITFIHKEDTIILELIRVLHRKNVYKDD